MITAGTGTGKPRANARHMAYCTVLIFMNYLAVRNGCAQCSDPIGQHSSCSDGRYRSKSVALVAGAVSKAQASRVHDVLSKSGALPPPFAAHAHRGPSERNYPSAALATATPQSVGSGAAPASLPNASAIAESVAAAIRAQLTLAAHIWPLPESSTVTSSAARASDWARLVAQIYEVDTLRCRRCGGGMEIIAFIIERTVIVRIFDHLGESSHAPRRAQMVGPPDVKTMQQRESL